MIFDPKIETRKKMLKIALKYFQNGDIQGKLGKNTEEKRSKQRHWSDLLHRESETLEAIG